MRLPDSSILTNIQVPGRTQPVDALFEKKYIIIRSLENRIYSDEELAMLPDIYPNHPHAREWAIRKRSARRLLQYLAAKDRPLRILEIGCGNGWLSHHIAAIPGTDVTGLDINFTELQQAARVFNDDPNLRFFHGDLRSSILHEQSYDCILFAASIQYFPSLKKMLYFTLQYLNPGGEIHIIDSHFYRREQLDIASKRTLSYFSSLGYPEMADFYFHHCLSDLSFFHYRLLFSPGNIRNRFLGHSDPFPWIRITR